MKDIIKHISFVVALCVFLSCSLREDFDLQGNQNSVEFVARLTGFNNVDVATKSAPTQEFETAVYTAYFLLFDNNTKERIAFESVDVAAATMSQTIIGKNSGPVVACFIANVPQSFAEGLTTVDAVNSAVLDITYATYSEAGGYLGVPKLTVNGETKLCIPMFGSKNISNITNGENIEIPVKRMFAKITVDLKLSMNLSGFQSAIQNLTNYELSYFNLHDLPNKVRLVEDKKSESPWKDGSGNPATFQSANVDAKIYNSTSSMEQKSYTFDCYVPEFYLNPKQNPTNDQRYKPLNKADGTFPIYLELVGQYNAYSITSTDINYKVYLGNDNVSDFSLARNTHYKNVLTIKGTNQNSTTPDNLDHRVTTSTINNPVAKAGKSANCYVINATGEYNFPAYKGAYNDLSDAVLCNNQTASELVILANDNSSNIELTDYVYDPERNLISFNVSKVANGNIVLGLRNQDGSLEWSWHLWFNQEFNAGALGQWAQINTQAMPNGTNEMIDRNLGASPSTLESLTAGAVVGNYYKYGHRAPYFTDSQNGAAYHGYKESDYSSWNTTDKSPTDPCPPGYRVPASSVWDTSISGSDGGLVDGFLYWSSGTNYIYYPYLGTSTGVVNKTYPNEVEINTDMEIFGYKVEGIPFVKYRNLVLSVDLKTEYGLLITNEHSLKYSSGSLNVNTSNLTSITSKFRIVSGEKNTNDPKWSVSWSGIKRTDNWSGYSPITSDLGTTDKLALLGKLYTSSTVISESKVEFTAINSSEGYQVRCVKEKE